MCTLHPHYTPTCFIGNLGTLQLHNLLTISRQFLIRAPIITNRYNFYGTNRERVFLNNKMSTSNIKVVITIYKCDKASYDDSLNNVAALKFQNDKLQNAVARFLFCSFILHSCNSKI